MGCVLADGLEALPGDVPAEGGDAAIGCVETVVCVAIADEPIVP